MHWLESTLNFVVPVGLVCVANCVRLTCSAMIAPSKCFFPGTSRSPPLWSDHCNGRLWEYVLGKQFFVATVNVRLALYISVPQLTSFFLWHLDLAPPPQFIVFSHVTHADSSGGQKKPVPRWQLTLEMPANCTTMLHFGKSWRDHIVKILLFLVLSSSICLSDALSNTNPVTFNSHCSVVICTDQHRSSIQLSVTNPQQGTCKYLK